MTCKKIERVESLPKTGLGNKPEGGDRDFQQLDKRLDNADERSDSRARGDKETPASLQATMINAGLMTVDVSATVSGAEGTAIDPAPGPEATEVKTVATKAGDVASAMTGLDSVPSGPGGPADSASTGAAGTD